jgi:Ca2+-binding RTX toxin-like protein
MQGIEDLSGTAHADTLTGDSFGNWFLTNGGDDVTFGGQGDDVIELGGFGASNQYSANAQADGGQGNHDTVSFLQADALPGPDAAVIASLVQGPQDTGIGIVSIIRFEDLQGTRFDDALTGDGGNNILYGWEGGDVLSGLGSNDTLYGDKSLRASGGNPTGGPHIIVEPDAPGNDTMDGGQGNDVLVGDGGADELTGGDNADTFVYEEAADSTSLAGFDTITDLNANQDGFEVWFQVTGVDATVATGKLRDTNFETDLAKAIKPNKLGVDHAVVFTPDTGNMAGRIFLVINADGAAGYQTGDIVIEITGATNLGALDLADFTTP